MKNIQLTQYRWIVDVISYLYIYQQKHFIKTHKLEFILKIKSFIISDNQFPRQINSMKKADSVKPLE